MLVSLESALILVRFECFTEIFLNKECSLIIDAKPERIKKEENFSLTNLFTTPVFFGMLSKRAKKKNSGKLLILFEGPSSHKRIENNANKFLKFKNSNIRG